MLIGHNVVYLNGFLKQFEEGFIAVRFGVMAVVADGIDVPELDLRRKVGY